MFRSKSLPKLRAVVLTIGVAVTTLATAPASFAQETAGLEEIIVTTQRRSESLQSVPLAVTAFSGAELEKLGIDDLKGITERTPGFTMGTFNAGQPQLYIRGIGSNSDSAAGDQSVIVFVDEVYIGRSAGMDLDLFDLERVEVLRGPQGTLFGKNVVGGAVNMITTKPSEESIMKAEVTVGNLGALNVRALASGQIGENSFGKISFSSRKRDGYVESLAGDYPSFFTASELDTINNLEQGEINTNSLRGALRFTPSDSTEINIKANFSKQDQDGPGRHFIDGPWRATDAALIADYDNRPLTNLADLAGHSKTDIFGLTARVDHDLANATFTSLTSYRNVDADISNLLLGVPSVALRLSTFKAPALIGGSNPYTDESDTFSQEFRLTSTNDGPLQWVAGLYYLQEETVRNEESTFGVFVSNGVGGAIGVVPQGVGGNFQDNTTTSYAVFGQASYSFNDQLKLTVGGRQTWEDKEMHVIGTPTPLSRFRDFDLNLEDDWSSFTPKATLDYQINDDAFMYLSYSEGFKSGGFPGGGNNATIASTGFDPEQAELVELGFKTEWFDSHLRLNGAIFKTDYQDLQILQLLVPVGSAPENPGNLITQNAANADIEGFELEFTWLPIDNLTIAGSYTSLDSAFSDFFIPEGFTSPGGGAPIDRTGNFLRNAPENAYNVLVRYEHELSNGAGMRYQADFRHKDEVFQDPDNLEFAKVPEYDIADFRIVYSSPGDSGYEITGWVKNAFDEEYLLHNFPVQGSGFATPAAPRTYGITIGWRR